MYFSASRSPPRKSAPPLAGIPIFGLDALSSAAYGPEAALTLLIPLGLAGVAHIVPITLAIIGLLVIVYFSYCQTIDAYPEGAGSYTVASENLGVTAGLLAAAALMIDYVLNAAVGISAGLLSRLGLFCVLYPRFACSFVSWSFPKTLYTSRRTESVRMYLIHRSVSNALL